MKEEKDLAREKQETEELFNDIIFDLGAWEAEEWDHYRRVYKKMAEIRESDGKTLPNECLLNMPDYIYKPVLKYFKLFLPESQFLIAQSLVYKEQGGEDHDVFENLCRCYEKFLEGDLITKHLNGPELITLLQDSNLLENIMDETWTTWSLIARHKEKIEKYIFF